MTLLHLPVESEGGHLDVAQFLIEHGADTTAQGEEGSTPLRGDPARFLVEHGANLNAAAQGEGGSTLPHRASSSGHPDLAQFLVELLEHGTDVAAQRTKRGGLCYIGHLKAVIVESQHGGGGA